MKGSRSLPHAGLVRGDPLGSLGQSPEAAPGPLATDRRCQCEEAGGGCGPERQHLGAGAKRPAQTGVACAPRRACTSGRLFVLGLEGHWTISGESSLLPREPGTFLGKN